MLKQAQNTFEQVVAYDTTSSDPCSINTANQGLECTVRFHADYYYDSNIIILVEVSNIVCFMNIVGEYYLYQDSHWSSLGILSVEQLFSK